MQCMWRYLNRDEARLLSPGQSSLQRCKLAHEQTSILPMNLCQFVEQFLLAAPGKPWNHDEHICAACTATAGNSQYCVLDRSSGYIDCHKASVSQQTLPGACNLVASKVTGVHIFWSNVNDVPDSIQTSPSSTLARTARASETFTSVLNDFTWNFADNDDAENTLTCTQITDLTPQKPQNGNTAASSIGKRKTFWKFTKAWFLKTYNSMIFEDLQQQDFWRLTKAGCLEIYSRVFEDYNSRLEEDLQRKTTKVHEKPTIKRFTWQSESWLELGLHKCPDEVWPLCIWTVLYSFQGFKAKADLSFDRISTMKAWPFCHLTSFQLSMGWPKLTSNLQFSLIHMDVEEHSPYSANMLSRSFHRRKGKHYSCSVHACSVLNVVMWWIQMNYYHCMTMIAHAHDCVLWR